MHAQSLAQSGIYLQIWAKRELKSSTTLKKINAGQHE
jgi:hypothetical protein